MATKQFAGESPYKIAEKNAPKADWVFKEFIDKVNLVSDKPTDKAPLVAALFGCGRAGTIHLSNIVRNPRVILKYIVDDRKELFDELKSFWKISDDVIFLTPSQSEKVYKDKSVSIAFVSAPTFAHRDIVVNCISNGKDVFCEKPIAQSMPETKKCYDAAKAKGRVLYAAFNRRFDPAYRNVKTKVREGTVGHVQVLRVTARDSPLPSIDYLKNSGGVFHDCLVHDFDMACWVLGELPIKVQATATALIPEIKAINDFDNIAYLLTFPSGTIVIGDNSRYSAFGYDQRLEVFGDKGMIKVDNEKPAPSTDYVIGHEGYKTHPIFYSFPSRYKVSYQHEVEHFLDVIQFGEPQDVNSWQVLAVSKIATAAEESARTNKVVEIDWSKDGIPPVYS